MGLWLLWAQDVNVPQELIARSKEVILDQEINLPLILCCQFNIKLIVPSGCHNSIIHTDTHTQICLTFIMTMRLHQQVFINDG